MQQKEEDNMDIDQIIWADSWWADNLQVIFDGMLSAEGLKGYPTNQLEINFSLSYCQGDGVGFFGVLDTEYLFDNHKEFIELFPLLTVLIKDYNQCEPNYRTSLHDELCIAIYGSQHNNTIMSTDVEISDIADMIEVVNKHNDSEHQYSIASIESERSKFEDHLQEWFDDIAHRLERIGYAEIESMESEDNIVEYEDDLKHTGGVMGV